MRRRKVEHDNNDFEEGVPHSDAATCFGKWAHFFRQMALPNDDDILQLKRRRLAIPPFDLMPEQLFSSSFHEIKLGNQFEQPGYCYCVRFRYK